MDAATPTPQALQFDTADVAPNATAAGKTCTVCKTPIEGVYHMAHTSVICPGCRVRLENGGTGDESAMVRFLRAAAFGVGASVAGTVIYALVLAATNTNFALIAILVGFMVGRAVHAGSRGRGGWAYQTLAIVLTYVSIVSSFTPIIAQGMREGSAGATMAGPVLWIVAFFMSLPFPFLVLTSDPITVLIIAIGLWQAWKQTRRPELNLSGPYYVNRPRRQVAVPGMPIVG